MRFLDGELRSHDRPLAGLGIQREPAPQERGALLHAGESNAAMDPGRGEPRALIADFQMQHAWLGSDLNSRAGDTSMARNVGERLLNDPKGGRGDFRLKRQVA